MVSIILINSIILTEVNHDLGLKLGLFTRIFGLVSCLLHHSWGSQRYFGLDDKWNKEVRILDG